jgi:hypothetical protein
VLFITRLEGGGAELTFVYLKLRGNSSWGEGWWRYGLRLFRLRACLFLFLGGGSGVGIVNLKVALAAEVDKLLAAADCLI